MRTVPVCAGLLLALLVAAAPARADVAPPRLVLEHAGEDPKSPLRFRPRAGASALYTLSVEQALSGELASNPPSLGAWFQSDVQRVDPDGSAEILTWLAGISNVSPDRDEVRQAYAQLLGLEVRVRMDARGGTSRATLGLRGQPMARPPAQVVALLGDLSRNAVPLPEEAVGVGARWTVDDTTGLMGARVRRRVTYALAARTADSVELDVAFSLGAEDVDVTGPRGGTRRMKRLKGEGSSRMSLQLTGVPLGELDVTLQLEVEPEAEDGRRAEPRKLTVRTRVARARDSFDFVRWKDGAPESLRCPEGTSPEEVLHDGLKHEPRAVGWRCARPDGTPHGPAVGVDLTGIRAFEGEYREGLRSGTWKVWPHPRSEALVSTWREGRLDGLNEERNPESELRERGEWRNGLKEGPFEVRDSEGVIVGRGSYVRGEREGPWTWTFSDLRIEVEYREGKRHGLQVEREASSGRELRRGTWKEDRMDGEWVTLKGGRVVERHIYRQGKLWTGEQTLKLPKDVRDGKFAEGMLREGKRQGPWTEWDTDYRSNPKAMGRYVDGKREGRWRTWHPAPMGTRILASEGDWRSDVKEGRWTYFNEEGRRVREETWSGGKLDGPFTLFHANGQKQEAGRYRNGLKEGEWARWDGEGELQWKGRFSAGKPVGPWSVRQGYAGLKTVLAGPGAPCPPWTVMLSPATDEQPLAGCRNLETGALEGYFTRLHETYGYAAESGSFVQGRKDGPWTLYYPSGNVLARGAYRAGFKEGPWTYFHDAKDRVLAEAAYTVGLRSGVWRVFHADGRPWMETRYELDTEPPEESPFRPREPEGRQPVARQAPHAGLTGRGAFPQDWLAPGEASSDELPGEVLHRELFPDGKPRLEQLWRSRRPSGVRRTWNEQGQELAAVDLDIGLMRVTKGPGGSRQEAVRQVDAKTFLEHSWDAQGRLLWVARIGERSSIQGPVTVWESGKPRWYLGVSRGVLQGPFRLPGPPGQPDVTGHALLNEIIEVTPGLCPPGTRLDAELREALQLRCLTRDGDVVLTSKWDAGLTLSHWGRKPRDAREEEEAMREETPELARPGTVSRYPEGRLRWEKEFQEDGPQRYRAWYPDGKPREEGAFLGSRPEGLWRGFAPDGTRLWEGRYDKGKPTGVWQVWYEDGSRRARYGFDAWRFARFWRRDGSLWKEMEVSTGAGAELWRWFSPDGRLLAEGALSKGAPIGPWRLDLDGDGTFESRSHPEHQPLRWRVDSADGQTRLEVLTAGDGNTGTWRLSDAQGPRDVSLREQGEVRKRWTRDAQGVLVAGPEPDTKARASEPPPWVGYIDEEAAPFMPDELATP